MYMKKLKIIVAIDKSELIKSNKRIIACGKNFGNVLGSSFGIKSVGVRIGK
ncbi:hypothetical protein [Clostridium estertheticum]|uniref:hypothetical protein n=1 Tax=Clostridium estertheticum TaxID=238834 RepID=UPI00129C439B|nr:hypothetical protein [Clostridium estertheticum]MBU3171955.1 hypothetical protein [Clostridium estertheticum]MBU3177936.1 hypothetical protein [Clostridium estertheticum]MBX4260845.1 hypothetical protein [Clostridium estertheticum]MBX4264362.1 hypothetical protein [Clostridium estertheticum]MBX4267944.1 hypothetical protein [Clostridium estertheticum]